MDKYYQSTDGYFELYKSDTFKVLSLYNDNSIDAIIADPPYFLSGSGTTCRAGERVSVNKGKWDKKIDIDEIHKFNIKWISECKRILKPNGTMWVFGTQHNIFSVGMAMKQIEMKILNDIIWEKSNPPPNLSCRFFTHSSEMILWASKTNKSKYVFNYADMKKINGNKQMKNIWKFNAPSKSEKTHGKHPTQKPLGLIKRIIEASTKEGDLILDPFCGSGTTLLAAKQLNRRCIGIDIDNKYLDIAIKRIK